MPPHPSILLQSLWGTDIGDLAQCSHLRSVSTVDVLPASSLFPFPPRTPASGGLPVGTWGREGV